MLGFQFFPKTEKYISLYMGKDDPEVKLKRDQLRERIKHNLLAAAAAGHDLEGKKTVLTPCHSDVILLWLFKTWSV